MRHLINIVILLVTSLQQLYVGVPGQIYISDEWPDSCTPVLDNIQYIGSDIVVNLKTKAVVCAQVITKFELAVNVTPVVAGDGYLIINVNDLLYYKTSINVQQSKRIYFPVVYR